MPLILRADGIISVVGKLGLDPNYVKNYAYKLRENAEFLSDRLGDLTGPMSLIAAVIPISLLIGALIWSSSGRANGEQTQRGLLSEGQGT